jgi:hypothetical protein
MSLGSPTRPRRDSLSTGLVLALAREAVGLDRARLARVGCAIEIAGPGPVAARAAAERLLARGARLLLSWGTAGALTDLAPGSLILPQTLCSDHGPDLQLDTPLRTQLLRALGEATATRTGRLISSAEAVTTIGEKRALQQRSGACAVDMESYAVADAALAAGAASLAVRVVVDAADHLVPSAATAALAGRRLRYDRMFVELLRQPGQLRPLLQLGRDWQAARATLQRCARALPDALADHAARPDR